MFTTQCFRLPLLKVRPGNVAAVAGESSAALDQGSDGSGAASAARYRALWRAVGAATTATRHYHGVWSGGAGGQVREGGRAERG